MRRVFRLALTAAYPALMAVYGFAAATPTEPEFHIPFEKYKLGNGLRVILARDNSIPLAAVYLIYDAGTRSEDKGTIGYAHLLNRLMFEGSEHLKKGDYELTVQSNGGVFGGADHGDYSDYSDVMPSNRLALALWLESDRMRAPAITDETIKAARTAIRSEKANQRSQPYREAMIDQWRNIAFANPRSKQSPLSDTDDLDAATAETVSKFFRSYYTPANAALVLCGDFNPVDARKMVDQYFGGITGPAAPRRPELSEPERTQGTHSEAVDTHLRVPAVIVGWPAPKRNTPEWYALEMLDAILTLGKGSKLEMELMRGRQSVLQVDENLGFPLSTAFDYRDPGSFAAMFIYKPTYVSSEIVRQYQDVLSGIASNGLDPLEFIRARTAFRLTRALREQDVMSRAQTLGLHEIIDGDAGMVDREYTGVMSVTPEQVRAVISKYLTPARADVLAIGSAKSSGDPK